MKDKYQYRIKKDATTYYYVSGGTVTTTTDAAAALLIEAVPDWGKIKFAYARHLLYWGIFKKYTPETVRFCKDAAKILRYVYNTQGRLNASATLEIMRLKSTTQHYELLDEYHFNFKPYKNYRLYVDVAIMQKGLPELITAFDTTQFAIDLDLSDTDVQHVRLDGVLLKGKYNFVTFNDAELQMIDPVSSTVTPQIAYANQEGPYAVGIPNMQAQGNLVWPGADFDSAYHFKSNTPFRGQARVEMYLRINNPGTATVKLKLWAELRGPKPGVSVIGLPYLIAETAAIAPNGSSYDDFLLSGVSSNIDFSNYGSTPATDNYLIFYYEMVYDSGSTSMVDELNIRTPVDPSYITLEYSYTQPQTVTRAISQWSLFKKLVDKMTSGAYGAKSDLLTTDVYPDDAVWGLNPYTTYYACGDAIRQLFDTTPQIMTNFKDFYLDAFLSNCAGIGIEKIGGDYKVVLESLWHFFQADSTIIDLGSRISDFTMTDYSDHVFVNLKSGYKDQTFDEGNAKYEWASEVNWKTNQTAQEEDTELICPYIAGAYPVEYTRANLANKKTTDSKNDNDTFKLQSNGSQITVAGYTPDPYILDKTQTVSAGFPSGVDSTVFNLMHTPKRQLLRLLPWLKANYYGVDSAELAFQSGAKNTNVAASLNVGSIVDESDDLSLISTGGDILFKPYIFEFKSEVPVNFGELVDANPYGVIKFTFIRDGKRHQLEGHLLEGGFTPGMKDTYNFKLLCSRNVDVDSSL